MSSVYFVQAGEGGPIKIGMADNVEERVRNLQCGNHEELRLLLTLPGGVQLERQLHRGLFRHRRRGEWFNWDAFTQSFVANVSKGVSVSRALNALALAEGLYREAKDLHQLGAMTRRFRRHRRDETKGAGYREHCSEILVELRSELAAASPLARTIAGLMMRSPREQAKLAERALRAGAKLRAVAA